MKQNCSFLILVGVFLISESIALPPLSPAETVPNPKETLSIPINGTLTERGPMKQIPGTTFFSGILYRVAKKTPKGSALIYVDDVVEGTHLLQVDSDPTRVHRYEDGNDLFGKDKWMFLEAPDFPGWYEIRHKFFQGGNTAVSDRKVADGFHIIVTELHNEKFGVGGSNRNYALWKPVGVNDEYYQLKNKQFPQGIVTNTTTGVGKNFFYIQIDTDPENSANYEEGGCNFDETLFSAISRPNFLLNAKVEQFIFKQIPSDISSYQQTSRNPINYESATVTGNMTSYKISQLYVDTNSFACIIEGSFRGFNRATVKLEIPAVGGLSAGSVPEMPLSADGTLTVTEPNEAQVSMDIEVPTNRFVHFEVRSEWYEDVPVLFEAMMKITGILRDGTPLSSNFIGLNLPVDWRNSLGSAENESTWQVKVEGKLLLSFGHQRGILTRLSLLPILD